MPNRRLNENDSSCSQCETKIRPTNRTGFCSKHYHQWWCDNKMKDSTKHKNRVASIQSCTKRKKERYHQDECYRLGENLRTRFTAVFKGRKEHSAKELVGCSLKELKIHLESQFLEGMNWQNHSYCGWHVDHIVPLSSFDLTNSAQVTKAFHYSNLQPLWAIDNLRKGNKTSE